MPTGCVCPDGRDLERFALGLLPESELEQLHQHLAACDQCMDRVQSLATEDAIVKAMRAQTGTVRVPEADVVEGLIERLSGLRLPDVGSSTGSTDTGFANAETPIPTTPPALDAARPASSVARGDSSLESFDFLSAPEEPDELGRLGPYRVLKLLGAGGMGIVFLAEDPQLKRLVALKVMRPALAADREARRRFLHEAQAAAAVEHDHIVAIHQVGEHAGVPFLAMQFLHGETLEDRLAREKILPISDVLRIGKEIAAGLAAAHAHNLIHRDVKPANIWLEARDQGSGVRDQRSGISDQRDARGFSPVPDTRPLIPSRVKILDFGLASAARHDVLDFRQEVLAGTPQYMSPEQARGEVVDARSDLFSLGCVLYRMCTGDVAFSGSDTTAALMALAVRDPRPPRQLNPDVPQPLSDMVVRLLAKKPADRSQSARDVVEAIEAIESETNRQSPVELRKSTARRAWRLPAMAAVVLLAFSGIIIYVNTSEGTLKLEVHEPDVTITVDGKAQDHVRIQSPRDDVEIKLLPGQHLLEVSKDGFVSFTKQFEIRRRGKVELTAILEPAELAPLDLGEPSGELAELAKRVESAAPVEDSGRATLTEAGAPLRRKLIVYRQAHLGSLDSLRAARLMARLPWPADALDREQIPTDELRAAGDGDPQRAPESLVGIFGETQFKHWSEIHSVAFLAGGEILASASQDNTVKLWDRTTGRARRSFRALAAGFRSVSVSPDGQTLAAGGENGSVLLWDLATEKEPRTCSRQHDDRITCMAFSPNGQMLASASSDGGVKLWDVASGQEIRTLKGQPDTQPEAVSFLCFSDDGETLVFAGTGRPIRIWDVASGDERPAHDDFKQSLRCAGRGLSRQSLVTVSKQGKTTLWELAAEQRRRADLVIPETATLLTAALSSDGQALATGYFDGTVKLWDVVAGVERLTLKGHNHAVNSLSFSSDDQILASGSRDAMRLWNVSSGREFLEAGGHAAKVRSVSLSADGQTLASASEDGTVKLWDMATGRLQSTLTGHTAHVYSVAFSPDGRTLATGSRDTTVRLWDVSNVTEGAKELRRWPVDRERVALAFSPDGQLLAAGCGDATARVWDVASGAERYMLRRHKTRVSAVAFSPDGIALATGSFDGLIMLWDVATGQERLKLDLRTGQVHSLAFSPDGGTLASSHSDGRVKLWDFVAGKERVTAQPLNHKSPAWSVVFSPDGQTLASASQDGMLRFWDPRTGRKRREISLGPGRRDISQITFTPDSRHLATANGNGTVYVLRLAAPSDERANK